MPLFSSRSLHLLSRVKVPFQHILSFSYSKTVHKETICSYFKQLKTLNGSTCFLSKIFSPANGITGSVKKGLAYHRTINFNTAASSRFMSTEQLNQQKQPIEIPKHVPQKHQEYGDLVYVPPLSGRVKLLKIFSLGTSVFGLACQPYIWIHAEQIPAFLKLALCGGVSFFMFGTPLLVHWMTKRYTLYMYFNKDTKKFTAVTYTLFVQKKYTTFSVDEIDYGEGPAMISNITVRGHPMMVDPDYFLDVDCYMHLMGYDRSIEWNLKMKEKN